MHSTVLFRFKSELMIIAALGLLTLTGEVWAEPDGITGVSGEFGTCSSCHGGGAYTGTASVSGATTVAQGSTPNFTLSLTSSGAADAGFNLKASGGTLNDTDPNAQKIGSELTHVNPQALSGNATSWTFSWTAPASSANYTFYYCINQVNGNRDDADGNPPFFLGEDTDGINGPGENGDNPACDETIITVNDPPVVTASGGSASHTEQIAVTVDDALTITDGTGETDNISEATITISGNYDAASGDRLTYSSCPAGAVCSGNGTQTIDIVGESSFANYQTAFHSVQFNTTSNDPPSTLDRTVQFSVTDTFSRTRSDTKTVTFTAVNDLPTIVEFGGTTPYTEGDPAIAVDGNITLDDDDDTDLKNAEMEISVNCVLTEDELAFGAACPGGLTCTQVDACTLTVSGTATKAIYETFLEAVTYNNSSLDPDTNDRTVRIQVQDASDGFSSDSTKTVTVTAFSDPPTISGVGGPLAYTENDLATTVDGTITLGDVDSSNLNRAEAEISTNCVLADRLQVSSAVCTANNISCTQVDNCTLTLVGTPTASQSLSSYEAVLEAITYHNTSDDPGTATRTVRMRVRDDSSNFSSYDDMFITVAAINDAPVANSDAFSVAVNSSDNELDVLANDTDVDSGDTQALVSVDTSSSEPGTLVVIGAPCAPGTLCYTPPADFTGVNTFTYTMEDSGPLQDTATVTVGGADTDGDGLIDFLDNCPNDANAGQEDNDNDGEGDACDDDDDNDGMSDTFENTYGLDPFDPLDADEDLDGDGRTNLEEYQQSSDPTTDDVEPDFSGVSNITVNAIAYLTPVSLGIIKAVDGADGAVTIVIESVTDPVTATVLPCNPLPVNTDPNYALAVQVCNEVRNSLFRPGRTVVTRTADDANGNTATVIQTVDVRPLANLLPNQVAVEGGVVQIGISLNGVAPEYPVTFDYSVFGTAGSADHDAASASLSIGAGTSGAIVVNLIDDGVAEGSETLVIALSNPQNAVLGNKSNHTVVIAEGNLAPAVTLNVAQAANTGPLIARDAGTVTITATVSDLNIGDTFTYDWSQLHGFLIALNGTGGSGSNTFEFDPTGLDAGVYEAAVSVTDSGSPAATASARVALNLKESSPVLTAIDSDGDGINDDVEGYQDVDGNGIVDYLDPFSSASGINLIPNQTGQLQKTLLVQTDAGLRLRMSGVGLSTGATGALVSQQNIATYVSQSGGAATLSEDTFRNIGGIYDFEIYGLPVGESANVVLPLSSGILLDAVYRKFDLQNGWHTFMANTNNGIRSAKSVGGVCPAPGHESYTMGLTAFDNCVQLTVQDGGPNDADGEANGVIRDPGGVAVADVTPEHETLTPDDGSGGGGGSLHPAWLLLGLIGWLVCNRRQMLEARKLKSEVNGA